MTPEQVELDVRICKEGWLKLSDLSKEYASISSIIHVDTRDFHINFTFEEQMSVNHIKQRKEALKHKACDIISFDEMITRLKEWREKSGGEYETWRFITHKERGWFKYVRILVVEKGFIWCTADMRFCSNRNIQANMEFDSTSK